MGGGKRLEERGGSDGLRDCVYVGVGCRYVDVEIVCMWVWGCRCVDVEIVCMWVWGCQCVDVEERLCVCGCGGANVWM